MARSVADIAVILDATVGYDPADPVTAMSDGRLPPSYQSSLKPDALNTARIGALTEFFGRAPEDQEVGSIVRAALEDMRTRGAVVVDVSVPDLSAQLAASNLLSQELKFYLGDYLKRSPGAFVRSVEELLASGLHTAQFQAFLEAANALPDDYLNGDDYRSRLAARESLGRAIRDVMEEHRLEAIVYPTARRIAPIIGDNQLGSNAGLAAQTGFPAITVPAGFTAGGFPVGVEMLGRPFAEATLIALAYSYEQATRHRRPPLSAPPLGETRPPRSNGVSFKTTTGGLRFEVIATGAQAIPPSEVPFQVRVRFTFDERTRELGYELSVSGVSPDQVAGVYLHRRANRPNGGVARLLAKAPGRSGSGRVTLLESEAADLKMGKCYVSAISKPSPRLSARANIVLPSA
jgi:hypothetical protein